MTSDSDFEMAGKTESVNNKDFANWSAEQHGANLKHSTMDEVRSKVTRTFKGLLLKNRERSNPSDDLSMSMNSD